MQDNRVIVSYISLDNLKLYETEIFFNQDYPEDSKDFDYTKAFICQLLKYNQLMNCYFESIIIVQNDDIIKLNSEIVGEINILMAVDSLSYVVLNKSKYKFLLYSFCGKLIEHLTDAEIKQYLTNALFNDKKYKITFSNPVEDIDNLLYLLFKAGSIITWSTSTNQWKMILADRMNIDKVLKQQNQNIRIANGCCIYEYNTVDKQAQFVGFYDDMLSQIYTIDDVLTLIGSNNVECLTQEFTLSVEKGITSKIELRDNNTNNLIDLVNQNIQINGQKYKVTMLDAFGEKSHYMSLKQGIKFLQNKEMQQRINVIVGHKKSKKVIKIIYDFDGQIEVKIGKDKIK